MRAKAEETEDLYSLYVYTLATPVLLFPFFNAFSIYLREYFFVDGWTIGVSGWNRENTRVNINI